MGEEDLLDPRKLDRALREHREKRRRDQIYFTVALAILGVGAIVAVGLVGYQSLRLEERVRELAVQLEESSEQSRIRAKALSLDLARQEQELSAIRRAATEDLRSIQDAYRRVATIQDPRQELSALREANEALWSELASQREALLVALRESETERENEAASPDTPPVRFELGVTEYRQSSNPGFGPPSGFLSSDERPLRSASMPPTAPGYLTIELTPETVGLGEPFRLVVELINRGNRPLRVEELRLDWSFGGGRNTGGAVALASASTAEPRSTQVLFDQMGTWEPSHERGGVVLTATIALADGSQLTNRLRW